MSEVTQILDRVLQGDPKAAGKLLPLVYGELRKLAAHKMTGETLGKATPRPMGGRIPINRGNQIMTRFTEVVRLGGWLF